MFFLIIYSVLTVSLAVLIWTYVGYPLFIRSLSTYYRSIKKNNSHTPSFSIIVPTYNEESVIEKKIRNLQSLRYPKDKTEIIIADDGSTDETVKIAKKFQQIKVIELKRSGKSSAVNAGLDKASGEIIVLSDADCFLDEYALSYAGENFFDSSVGAVAGSVLTSNPRSTFFLKGFTRRDRWLAHYESLLDSVATGMGGFLAYRAGLVKKLESICLADDVDISIHVRTQGYRVVAEPRIVVLTWDTNKFTEWYSQTVRRTFQGLATLLYHKSILFKRRYGWYGTVILPTRLLFHRLSPFLFLAVYLSLLAITPLLSFMLLPVLLVSSLLSPILRKFLIIQVIFLSAWFSYAFQRDNPIWKRGPRVGET